MSTQADSVDIKSLVWSNITKVDNVNALSGGGADIYLVDGDGDDLNIEMEEEATIALRDALIDLYPLEEEEESEQTANAD